MSYDLCFWAQRPVTQLPPQTIYRHLSDGDTVEDLLPIPLPEYLAAIAGAFPTGRQEPNGTSEWFVWEGTGSMFEITWSPVHVLVTMRPLDKANANRLIEVGATHGLFLYDPQTDERFAPPAL